MDELYASVVELSNQRIRKGPATTERDQASGAWRTERDARIRSLHVRRRDKRAALPRSSAINTMEAGATSGAAVAAVMLDGCWIMAAPRVDEADA